MSRRPRTAAHVVMAVALLAAGCSSMPDPGPAPPPGAGAQGVDQSPSSLPPISDEGYTRIVVGAGDSTSILPGTPGAAYRYRFRMISPGNERNAFKDRDLSFYFRPSPASIYFQIQNLQNRPVVIDWDQSRFLQPNGQIDKIAHSTTRWDERFSYQPQTTVNGLQTYGDYVFNMISLVDPAGTNQQLHRALLPEDQQAMQFTDRVFGMDLVVLIEGRPRTYQIRFKVESVTPN